MHILSRGRDARRRAEIAVARSGRLRELPRRDHRETRELDGAYRAAPQQSPLRSRRARARGEGQGAGVYRLPHRGRCTADGGAAARSGPVSGLSRNPDGASRRTGYRLCDLSPVARSGGLIDAGGRGGFSRAAFAQRSTLAEPGGSRCRVAREPVDQLCDLSCAGVLLSVSRGRITAKGDCGTGFGPALDGPRGPSGAGIPRREFRRPPRRACLGEHPELRELPRAQRLPRLSPDGGGERAALPRRRLPGPPSSGGLRARDLLRRLPQRAKLLRVLSPAVRHRRRTRPADRVSRRATVLRLGTRWRGPAKPGVVRQLSYPGRLPEMSFLHRRAALQSARPRLRRGAAAQEERPDVRRVSRFVNPDLTLNALFRMEII